MDKRNEEKLNEFNKLKQKGVEEDNLEEKIIDDKDEDDYYDELEDPNYRKKKIMKVIITIVLLSSTVVLFWTKGYEIVNFAYDVISNEEVKDEVSQQENNEVVAVNNVDLEPIYDMVHMMANTIIVAEDGNIWGTQDITQDLINSVIEKLEGPDDYLCGELKKWLKLDFSNGVEVHNYVWKKLGGTVGKAKELNEDAIQTTITNLGE